MYSSLNDGDDSLRVDDDEYSVAAAGMVLKLCVKMLYDLEH